MSKTVGSILQVAGIAAFVVATAGAGLAVAGGFSIGAGIAQVAAGIGLPGSIFGALALSGLATTANALFGPNTPKPEQLEGAIKSPTPARVSGYGTNRYFIAYSLFVTAEDGTAIDVGVFHDGKVGAIRGHYLGDVKVRLSGGYVQKGEDGQFGENVIRIGTRLGNATETAFSEVIAKVPDQWTSQHRGDGCVTGFVLSSPVKAKHYQEVYPTGGPNQMPLSLVLDAQPVFDWRDPAQSIDNPATWAVKDNTILATAHYLMVRDNKDWDTHFAPTIDYWTEAANVCDDAIPLKGVQTILTAKADEGDSSITVASVNGLSVGMTIAISATGDTSLTETKTVVSVSQVVGGGVWTIDFSGELENDHPQGSQVTWASDSGSPATEPRYRTCVAHKHTDPHKGVLANLLSCCDGWMAPRSDGALIVYAGKYVEPDPADEIGPDEIVAYSLQYGVDEEDAVNQIAVSYVSANHDYNTVDTDAWEDLDDQAKRGKVLADAMNVQSPSFSQNRRLAKAKRSRAMAPWRGSITTNTLGRRIRGKRYFPLRIEEAGTVFFQAVAEVMRIKRNYATGGYDVDWVKADPNAYAWDAATEEGEPAPVGNKVAPAPLAAPTIESVTPVVDGANLRLEVVVTGPDRTDITWHFRWRIEGDASWAADQDYSDIEAGTEVTITTGFVPVGQSLEVEVSYSVGDGRLSPWTDPYAVDTSDYGVEYDGGDAAGNFDEDGE